jgi:hypothetical protein
VMRRLTTQNCGTTFKAIDEKSPAHDLLAYIMSRECGVKGSGHSLSCWAIKQSCTIRFRTVTTAGGQRSSVFRARPYETKRRRQGWLIWKLTNLEAW